MSIPWEIHEPNHVEIAHNTLHRPAALQVTTAHLHICSWYLACTYRCGKHWIHVVLPNANTAWRRWNILWSTCDMRVLIPFICFVWKEHKWCAKSMHTCTRGSCECVIDHMPCALYTNIYLSHICTYLNFEVFPDNLFFFCLVWWFIC